ncbi:unnamed protein product [Caenorhabditis bovis]|uniref:DOMON domain-containing protein n=1 Tax=Caenorhabditis bovis TaxID=2654633 RepID=A0A8S1F1H5_9PELO|nr:unnamed protein product [Caenorhabditis bovis]
MMLKVALLLLSLCSTGLAKKQLNNCLDDNKYCLGLPRNCIGAQCHFAYSFISNGTHLEIELLGKNIIDRTWLAIAYSTDKYMEDDLVVFCLRDDGREKSGKSLAGLAYNEKHENKLIGTIDELNEDNDMGFDLKMVDYNLEDQGLYCKFTHKIDPIVNEFNTTKLHILMSKGVWMKDNLSYHGKTRSDVGSVDVSGVKKRKSSGSLVNIFPPIAALALAIFIRN